MKRLDRFRRRVNRALALGPLGDFDLPVSPEGDPCLVVVAVEDEPISVVLNRLQAVGGHANLIVGGTSEVRIVSVTGIQTASEGVIDGNTTAPMPAAPIPGRRSRQKTRLNPRI